MKKLFLPVMTLRSSRKTQSTSRLATPTHTRSDAYHYTEKSGYPALAISFTFQRQLNTA